MVERFFRKAHVRRRLEEGPVADILRGYLGQLEERGYSKFTIHRYVWAAEHFGRWLARSGRAVVDADAAAVQEFLTHHLPRCRCRALRSMVGGSVLFTWIYGHTRGSLLLAIVTQVGAHLNNPGHAMPAREMPIVIHTVSYVILAVVLLIVDRTAWRRPEPPL